MPRLRLILACLVLMLNGIAAPLWADTPVFFSTGDTAISGYDAVAYFTTGQPVPGQPDIAVTWKGVIWRFVSVAHREAFEANPRAYAPQYGGYCAYAVSLGYRASTEPEAWHIENGKLYLINNSTVRAVWSRDIDGNIIRADANWPGVLDD